MAEDYIITVASPFGTVEHEAHGLDAALAKADEERAKNPEARIYMRAK